jgi:HK97 family phage prohead protease
VTARVCRSTSLQWSPDGEIQKMTIVHKAVAEKGDGLEFVLSDSTVDRYGDIVEASGWVLTNFKKNPIALFGHSSGFPIGNWANLRIEGGKLIGRLVLAAKGTSDRIDELRSLIEQGILRAVSVGFRPIESDPIDPKQPWGAQRYKKQELLECSLVSVPANPAALQLAKSLNLSTETVSLAFGEQAGVRRRDLTATGEQADLNATDPMRSRADHRPSTKDHSQMKTVSQRLEEAQLKLAAKQQRHAELINADDLDTEAVEAVSVEIAKLEKDVAVLQRSEATMAKGAGGTDAPAINRRPLGFPKKEVSPLDLLVRKGVIFAVSEYGNMSIDKALDERYPGHETTALVCKAEAPLGTTSGSHFVDDLQRVSYQGFLDALDGRAVFPSLRASSGLPLSFDSSGTAYIPGVSAGGANGSFFAEGSPMRVGKITTTSGNMTPRKMGVIIPFSREAAKRSTPNLEALVRRRILADSAAILDSHLLDATAEDSVRPGGLLYNIAAVATGYGGGDHTAVKEDFKALLTPFINAKAAGGITIIMNPIQGLSISMMDGPDNNPGWFTNVENRVTLVESEHATAGRLIAVRTEDLATALGAPEFEVSNQATIHMEDTTPAAITTGGGPTVASPVRSFFQTDSMGVRMVLDVNWKMIRSGVVQWIDGTSY